MKAIEISSFLKENFLDINLLNNILNFIFNK